MKKTVSVILALILALSCVMLFASCSGNTDKTTENATDTADVTDNANTAAGRTFVMGIDPEYPPFASLDDEGNYSGFDVEICKAACDYLGWNFEVFGVNWENKLMQLDAKECDCIWAGMTILDSMKEAGYVLSEPYFDNTQVLLVKEGSEITSSADLAGKVVAVQLGTSGEKLLSEGGDLEELAGTFKELVTSNSFVSCFAELAGNAVDAVLVDQPVAQAYVSKNDGFVILDEKLGNEQYGICFRNGEEDVCAAIEEAVQVLVENGTYAEIAAKYAPDISENSLIFLNK